MIDGNSIASRQSVIRAAIECLSTSSSSTSLVMQNLLLNAKGTSMKRRFSCSLEEHCPHCIAVGGVVEVHYKDNLDIKQNRISLIYSNER